MASSSFLVHTLLIKTTIHYECTMKEIAGDLLERKQKDIYSQFSSTWWKGHNRIWFQVKDNVMSTNRELETPHSFFYLLELFTNWSVGCGIPIVTWLSVASGNVTADRCRMGRIWLGLWNKLWKGILTSHNSFHIAVYKKHSVVSIQI